jgi:Uma2 family endonuclease
MPAIPKHRMNVDEFLAWAEGRPGRWELEDGRVVSMSPERVLHARTKYYAQGALSRAIRAAGLPCHMLPNGMAVRVGLEIAFEPDALVHCGAPIADDAIEVSAPVVIVEVLSESTARRDHGAKLKGYFSLPSVQHYLIVDADKRTIIHHRRGGGAALETMIVSGGAIRLDPPGLEVPVDEIFAEPV